MRSLPFQDLLVIEFASVLAGPSVGQFFAELGAEVIKIENPNTKGDVTRTWKGSDEVTDDRSAYFCSVNWGKKSLVLDVTKNEHLKILYQLVKKADVVITSYKPGDDIKLKVDYQTLKNINSKIIYGQITGYGSNSTRVGYDAIVQAESGFMAINGEEKSMPLKMPVALMDLIAGHQLKQALLLGIIERQITGEGSYHEVSLIESGLSSLANQATNFLIGGQEPTAKGSLHPNIAPYGEQFQTQDGKRIVLAIGNDKQFSGLIEILGLDLSDNFSTNELRLEKRHDLARQIEECICKWQSEELMNELNARNIPAGVINHISEAIDKYGQKLLINSPDQLQSIRTFVANAERFKNLSHILPPPHLGEHSDEIIASIS